MEQAFEFVSNHLLLVTAFGVLLVALLVTENRRSGKSVSIAMATQLINREEGVVLDLRNQSEYSAGHIVDALNIPYTSLASRMTELDRHKEKPLILVCKMGQHSRAVSKTLMKAGFLRIVRMQGGMAEWSAANLPLVKS